MEERTAQTCIEGKEQVDSLAKERFKKYGVKLLEERREVEKQPQKREQEEEEQRKVKRRSSAVGRYGMQEAGMPKANR